MLFKLIKMHKNCCIFYINFELKGRLFDSLSLGQRHNAEVKYKCIKNNAYFFCKIFKFIRGKWG